MGEEPRGGRRIMKVFTVIEKPNSPRGIWLEIGVASENRDGSFSAKLDCLPMNGSLQIRPYEAKRQGGFKRQGAAPETTSEGWSKGGER